MVERALYKTQGHKHNPHHLACMIRGMGMEQFRFDVSRKDTLV